MLLLKVALGLVRINGFWVMCGCGGFGGGHFLGCVLGCVLGLGCFCLVVVVGFLCAFVFARLRFGLYLGFRSVFEVYLVVVVVAAYLKTTVTNCSGSI